MNLYILIQPTKYLQNKTNSGIRTRSKYNFYIPPCNLTSSMFGFQDIKFF